MVPSGDRLTVLFVDDEPAALRLVVRQLHGEPLEVLTASSAAEALDLLSMRRVDVLVSDIDMPGMGGLELMRVARHRFPATLRMLLTGAATLTNTLEAINNGEVARFLQKPFDRDQFQATLRGLEGRIAETRREEQARCWKARREQFIGWVERRFPGVTAVQRDERGRLVIDVPGLLGAADHVGSAARDALFWWTRSTGPVSVRDTMRTHRGS
jgi:CheY-like chemotaxis protein